MNIQELPGPVAAVVFSIGVSLFLVGLIGRVESKWLTIGTDDRGKRLLKATRQRASSCSNI